MKLMNPAEQMLGDGDLDGALQALQLQVRARPADASLRVFLFQLLSVMGRWDRALNQLTVAGELDPACLPMVQTYQPAIQCERLRQEVFQGRRAPLLFGEPLEWVALLIEALLLDGRGDESDAQRLRDIAFEQAPPQRGMADGKPFAWIADADMRLGPVLEALVNGRYYWVPFVHLASVAIDSPEDLRDRVWMPAQLEFANGGTTVALIPTRYAGTDLDDGRLALARETRWHEPSPSFHIGAGQRVFATDDADIGLMDVRAVAFDAA